MVAVLGVLPVVASAPGAVGAPGAPGAVGGAVGGGGGGVLSSGGALSLSRGNLLRESSNRAEPARKGAKECRNSL